MSIIVVLLGIIIIGTVIVFAVTGGSKEEKPVEPLIKPVSKERNKK